MKVAIIGTGRRSRIGRIIAYIEAMEIPELQVVVDPDELHRETDTIIVNEAQALFLAGTLNSYSSANDIHDALYTLIKATPDPVQEPIIKEKKRKLPRKIRAFAGFQR